MKKLRFFIMLFFLASLLAGYSAGQFLFNKKAHHTQEKQPTVSPKKSTGGQESLWLITVDRLDKTTPKIIGIWLLAYIPNYTVIRPLPLYPSNNPQNDAELVKVFHITSDRKISAGFWDFLQKHNHFVRDYIVIDEAAAASIINIYGGVTVKGKYLSGQDALSQISKPWYTADQSIQNQVVILDSICKSIFNSNIVPDMSQFHKETRNHILSNLELGAKLQEWQVLIVTGSHKVCDFSDLLKEMQITAIP